MFGNQCWSVSPGLKVRPLYSEVETDLCAACHTFALHVRACVGDTEKAL